jgi:HlyD family secretion protein
MEKRRPLKRLALYLFLCLLPVILPGCKGEENTYDASGTFEATETIVPSQANGIIKMFNVQEGEILDSGQVIGYVDSTQLYLEKRQLEAQIGALLARDPDIAAQTAALQARLSHALHEQRRLVKLARSDAATPKQLDDANAEITLIKKQITAQQSSLDITSGSLRKAALPLRVQIAELDDRLMKCRIVNPVKGTVLTKYAQTSEMAAIGKPLYTIADLSTIILRAYITEGAFTSIKLGQRVKVLVDDGKGGVRGFEGTVEWLSDEAEFTPKTIQTRDERANLVYAVKIRVRNDGTLKIGMYGEVKL